MVSYLIAKKPSKHMNLKTELISEKPALFNISIFPCVEKGSKTVFNEFVLARIDSAVKPCCKL